MKSFLAVRFESLLALSKHFFHRRFFFPKVFVDLISQLTWVAATASILPVVVTVISFELALAIKNRLTIHVLHSFHLTDKHQTVKFVIEKTLRKTIFTSIESTHHFEIYLFSLYCCRWCLLNDFSQHLQVKEKRERESSNESLRKGS